MAISLTPGQVVAAPDWEALFAQHGGARSNVLRPPTKAEQEAALTSDDDLEQNPIYRYYASDGSYVEARRAPNGDYQIVEYKPSQQFTQAETKREQQQTPAQQQEAKLNDERSWHEQQGHGRLTHAEYNAQQTKQQPQVTTEDDPTRPGVQGIKTVTPASPTSPATSTTVWRDASGRDVGPPQTQAQQQGIKVGSRTTKTLDGKAISVTTYRRPDNTEYDVVDQGQIQQPPVQVDGRWGVWTQGEGDAAPRFVEAQLPEQPAFTYPELRAQYGNITNEISAIAKDIYAQVGTGPGTITLEQANARMKPIYEQAASRVNELNAIVSTQKGVWDQQANFVSSQQRTGEARLRAATDWMSQSQQYMTAAGQAGPEGGRLFGELAAMYPLAAASTARGIGGLTDYQLPQMGGYLAQVAGAAPGAASAPPGAPPGAPPAGIGPNAIGTVPAPGGQAAASVPGYLAPAAGPGPVPMPQYEATPPGMPGPVPMPQYEATPPGMPGPVPMPQMGAPAGIAPITINVGGAPQQPTAQHAPGQQQYLQPAAQDARPSLQQHQRLAAGSLLQLGYPESVVDEAWRRRTGQSLLRPGGGGGMVGSFG